MALSTTVIAAPKDDTNAKLQALQQRGGQSQQPVAAAEGTADASPGAGPGRCRFQRRADPTSSAAPPINIPISTIRSRPPRRARIKASVDNGRLQITSADGRFSAALRILLSSTPAITARVKPPTRCPHPMVRDFGSGSNFRRMYLGLSGRVFGDWTYNANFDFGGSGGTETPGHIQSVYLEYDGLAPWGFRIGAFPPPSNFEDSTALGRHHLPGAQFAVGPAAQHRRRRRPRRDHAALHGPRPCSAPCPIPVTRLATAPRRWRRQAPPPRPLSASSRRWSAGLSWLPCRRTRLQLADRGQRHLCNQAARILPIGGAPILPPRPAARPATPSPCPIRRN